MSPVTAVAHAVRHTMLERTGERADECGDERIDECSGASDNASLLSNPGSLDSSTFKRCNSAKYRRMICIGSIFARTQKKGPLQIDASQGTLRLSDLQNVRIPAECPYAGRSGGLKESPYERGQRREMRCWA